MSGVVAERPRCPKGHGFMVLHTPGTPEQEWCGTWYVCPPGRPGESCRSAALLPSPALLESYRGHVADEVLALLAGGEQRG